jgi:valyl-tRNA synthetase
MGHALQHSIHDVLVRWQRMRGKVTLCVPGMDHAGIGTVVKVEAELRKEGVTRQQLGRERFLERMWQWKQQYGGEILKQFRLMGCSYDWSRERFTLDDHYHRAVLTAFVELYHRGYIYRGHRVVNWCPRCESVISDLEVRHEEIKGHLWHVRYPYRDAEGCVVVATTRPETMLGDTAVAVNPRDQRYQDHVGKTVILPLMNREIPIIADDYADPEFGTGAVKVTPAHDPFDFEAGQRHGLPAVVVIGEDGRMTAEAGRFADLDRFQARDQVVEALKAEGLLVDVEDHVHAVGHCDRCGTMIEPLMSEQWFLQQRRLGAPALQAIRDGRVRFTPERFAEFVARWLEEVRDWPLSRQLWWGHRIPIYYCDCGETIASVDPPEACPKCAGTNLCQDEDVLDTWFSSAIWPFAVLGWPNDSADLDCFYPTDLLITDRMILWLWVARMIMTGLEFLPDREQGGIPFYEVLVHPTVLARDGRRMSRSLGTGVDPLELMEQYGADAMRLGMLIQCATTQDVKFNEERIAACRNFCNKIWNASRFVLMNIGDTAPGELPAREAMSAADRWILSRWAEARDAVEAGLESYRFDEAALRLYDFFWSEFCDWYVELAKPALRSDDAGRADAARRVLATVLEATLRLLHPFMPFITEEIWQRLPHVGGVPASIMVAPWPEPQPDWRDADAEAELSLVMLVTDAVRSMRAEAGLGPSDKVGVMVASESAAVPRIIGEHEAAIAMLARAQSIDVTGALESAGSSPAGLTQDVLWQNHPVRVGIALALDPERLRQERERTERDLRKARGLEQRAAAKLDNPNFVDRAPADVVAKVRAELVEHQTAAHVLEERLRELEGSA